MSDTATEAKAGRPAHPEEPEAEPDRLEDLTAIRAESEAAWATATDLRSDPFEDHVLPVLGRKVRIRILDDIEITDMCALPEIGTYPMLIAELNLTVPEKRKELADKRNLAVERVRYMAGAAHRAVMQPDAALSDLPCADCGQEHPLSLWTTAQARRLEMADLARIVEVAEDVKPFERLVPFSEGPTPPDSSPPADTGESTQPQSSAPADSSTEP